MLSQEMQSMSYIGEKINFEIVKYANSNKEYESEEINMKNNFVDICQSTKVNITKCKQSLEILNIFFRYRTLTDKITGRTHWFK